MAVLWPSVSQDEKVSQSFFAVWSACIKTSLDPLPEAPSGLLILGREDLAWLLNRRCGSRGKLRKDWLQPWPVFSVSPDRSRAQAQLRVSFAAAVLNFFPGGGDLALNHPPVEDGFLWQTVHSVCGTFLQRRNSQPGIYCSWLFFRHHSEGRGVFIYTAFLEQFLGSFTFVGFTYSRLALIYVLFQFLQELHE